LDDLTSLSAALDSDSDMKDAQADAIERDGSSDGGRDGSDTENVASGPAAIGGQEGFKSPLKSTKDRRRSTTGSAVKSKTLNKKASRATLTNLNAQPGEQYLVKLKGFPPWPVIIADEDMLPEVLVKTRPVSAMKADGTWNEAFDEGAKRINERKWPIMYLHTNEL